MSKKRLHARVYGRVQGVGFRFFVCEVARELGLTGYVRNTPDGAVEVLAEGEEDLLAELSRLLRDGPRAARVTRADTSWEPPTGEFDGFFVKS